MGGILGLRNSWRIGWFKDGGIEFQLGHQLEISSIEQNCLLVSNVLVRCGGVADGWIGNGHIVGQESFDIINQIVRRSS